jgi:Uma2 family endonuclease
MIASVEAALEPIHRLTVEDVFAMLDAGVLSGDERVELIDGILLDVPPAGEPHSQAVAWLTEHFVRGIGPDLQVRVQDTLFVPRGFLSPDLIVIGRDSRRERLTTALLAIEVTRTTRGRDEGKVVDYAQAGVLEYWRIDLETAEVVVRRRPTGDAYEDLRRYTRGEALQPSFDAPALDVAAVLELA